MSNDYINHPLLLVITVSLEYYEFSVDEDAGPAQPVLVFSNPSSTDITIRVTNTDGSAIGEYCSILLTINIIMA